MRELSLHILDAVQNSIEADANKIYIKIREDYNQDKLIIKVEDNGKGMTPEFLRDVLDPFKTTRKTRHVGLGLPLFSAAAKNCSGDFKIDSRKGKGTKITATFQHSHIDRAPLGDMVGTILAILCSDKELDLYYNHQVNNKKFEFNTKKIKKILGNIPLANINVIKWLKSYLKYNFEKLYKNGGVLIAKN